MNKVITVATDVQRILLEQCLLAEITDGFWKQKKDEVNDEWRGFTVVVGLEYGVTGVAATRNFNFLNPKFFDAARGGMLALAQTVEPTMTQISLKKQLVFLNQIFGSRIQANSSAVKMRRGRSYSNPVKRVINGDVTTTKVPAIFAENAV